MSTAARQARPALSGLGLEVDPDDDAVGGTEAREPVDLVPRAVLIMMTNSRTATAAAVPMATRSSPRRAAQQRRAPGDRRRRQQRD